MAARQVENAAQDARCRQAAGWRFRLQRVYAARCKQVRRGEEAPQQEAGKETAVRCCAVGARAAGRTRTGAIGCSCHATCSSAARQCELQCQVRAKEKGMLV